jgi:hypothetical protein
MGTLGIWGVSLAISSIATPYYLLGWMLSIDNKETSE